MSKRALLAISLAGLMALGGLVGAYAQGGKAMPAKSPTMETAPSESATPSGPMMGRWHHVPSLKLMMEKLGITPEQKAKIRALYIAFANDTRKDRAELWSLKNEKHTMILSGKIDQQKLAQIDDQIVKLRGDILRAKLKLSRDRLALLTPEQQNRVADWAAERAFRMELKGHHYWGGRHGMGGMMHRGMMRGMMEKGGY